VERQAASLIRTGLTRSLLSILLPLQLQRSQAAKGPSVVKRLDFRKVLWRSEQGQTVSEYTFVLAVVLLIAVTALHYIGAQALDVFSRVANYLR
jgi:hypothetical protein